MFHDCTALQAAEKALYDVIGKKYPSEPSGRPSPACENAQENPGDGFTETRSVDGSSCSSELNCFVGSYPVHDQGEFQPIIARTSHLQSVSPNMDSCFRTQFVSYSSGDQTEVNYFVPSNNNVNYAVKLKGLTAVNEAESDGRNQSSYGLGGNNYRHREDGDFVQEGRSNKQLASSFEEPEQSELFDKVLLCPRLNPGIFDVSEPYPAEEGLKTKNKLLQHGQSKQSKAGRPWGKKQGKIKAVVDLRSLLSQCAQAVASSNIETAGEIIKQIRQHSTPYGDGMERLALYFVNAIESRLAGDGTDLYAGFISRRITAADILKAYQAGARGSRDTNVPFTFNAIAKRWDTIQLEDLKIDKDELIVVNSLYRLRNVPDETVVVSSPRDNVLKLVRSINPDMFIQGILNGTYNAPFFVTRFREALFHFPALFDMFEATTPREDHERMVFVRELFARDATNVIACEGIARIERPETYKQWQVRNLRAGFRQLPLNPDILKVVRAKVKLSYHNDFLVDEDSNWMLQGSVAKCSINCLKEYQVEKPILSLSSVVYPFTQLGSEVVLFVLYLHMDALVANYPGSLDDFHYNHHSNSAHSYQNHANLYNLSHGHAQNPILTSEPKPVDASPSSDVTSEGEIPEERDYFDGVLKYMNQMLMEEDDLENKPCMFHDCSALQAAEKSFYDALGQNYPPSSNGHPPFGTDGNFYVSPDDDCSGTSSSHKSSSFTTVGNFVESNWIEPFIGLVDSPLSPFQDLASLSKGQLVFQLAEQKEVTNHLHSDDYVLSNVEPKTQNLEIVAGVEINGRDHPPNGPTEKKHHYLEDNVYLREGRSNKLLASSTDDSEGTEMYDEVLLCPRDLQNEFELCPYEQAPKAIDKLQPKGQSKRSNAGRPRGKRQGNRKEMVDFTSLLTQCAQAVSSSNARRADELLKRIRQHSSPYGDAMERLAYYFANAIEARLAGTGTALYTAFTTRRNSAADILKAYQVYVTACPFRKMSNIFSNKSIGKLTKGATKLHIIDFGILYGFQWPCLIQGLSLRPGGPPKLRITGIDLPQPGFRPAERVQDTGRRLANYCKRFNVPFEFKAIAKKWDSIQLEELEIQKDEMVVVNCLYRLGNVPDEIVEVNSPRDNVLNLIKRINPITFIHGVVNGTYNASFFATRFREALFHFSALFDMFEATIPRENPERRLFEQEVFARDAMNVIACEGTARIERPETYKQWQVRNMRAGFRQQPLYPDIVKEVSTKVKLHNHKDFIVDQDSHWMLQGWKGRVVYALSCWKPVEE
ncbi:hypothetical protein RJ639_002838 [Escallonia herrerae]|uniref:Scarecrow-like protein 9 n=1 Tax=Escallonia herrerae TaxID=1293975 RepID=A0AA89B1G1_9ASTE|nr:hypothetical protein RJ639_002838 [Escallonia herrerae]